MGMTVEQARAAVLAMHQNPQRRGMVELHFGEIAIGLQGLANLGHSISLDLAPAGATEADQYPKMLYKRRDPGHRIANNQTEEKTLRANGWNEFPGGEKPSAPPPGPFEPPPEPVPVATINVAQISGSMPLKLPE